MSKQTIAIDIDDVLADSAAGFVSFSNNKWGTNLTVDDYTEDWAVMWQIEHAVSVQRAQTIYQSGVVRNFQHSEESIDVLKKLKQNYKLVVTTSRSKKVQEDTHEWLDRHYQGIFDDIHFAGFYDVYTPHSTKMTKAELCKSIGADYIVDDHPKHCFAAAEAGIKAVLFGDYIWSRKLGKLPPDVTRARNWSEVLKYFENERN